MGQSRCQVQRPTVPLCSTFIPHSQGPGSVKWGEFDCVRAFLLCSLMARHVENTPKDIHGPSKKLNGVATVC